MMICLQASDSDAEAQQSLNVPSIHQLPTTGLYTTGVKEL